MKVKVIGQMDNSKDRTFESANRIYDVKGLAPTVNTCGGGGLQPKVIRRMNLTSNNTDNTISQGKARQGKARQGKARQGKHSWNNAGLPSDEHGIQPLWNIPDATCEGLQRPYKGHKEIRILGGIGNMWGRQYHNQDRVYDRHGISGAVNASGNNGLVIRAWRS